MKKEDFERLQESIIEAGQMAHGQRAAAREVVYEASWPPASSATALAVCVETDDPALLIPRKIYEVTVYENDLVRVIDEAGEATICPSSFFMPVNLPEVVAQALARIA